jgi:4-alpha-glucanotransferase
MSFSRASGILLHPTCFPSRFGIGDLGPEAYRFIDFLERNAQRLWQLTLYVLLSHGRKSPAD